MSWRVIWAMPARRPGASAQKSASQRLWACSPAQRRSASAAVTAGGWAVREVLGKNGGTVFGKMHLGHLAVGLEVGAGDGPSPSCGRRGRP